MSRADRLASLERILLESGLPGAFSGLYGYANGISSVVNYAASSLAVRAAGGSTATLRELVIAINLAASGAGGLDTGVLAANSWYSTWAIWNPTTNAVAGIAALCPVQSGITSAGSLVVTGLASTAGLRVGLPFAGGSFPVGVVIKSVDGPTQITASLPASASATASLCFLVDPVLPAGFTHKARVGMARTDATANKFPLGFAQRGKLVQPKVAAGSNVVALPRLAFGSLGSVITPTWVSVALANFVPPTCGAVGVIAHIIAAGGAVIVAPNASYGAHTSTTNPAPIDISNNTLAIDTNTFAMIVLETMELFCAAQDAAAYLALSCYEDNL